MGNKKGILRPDFADFELRRTARSDHVPFAGGSNCEELRARAGAGLYIHGRGGCSRVATTARAGVEVGAAQGDQARHG